MFELPGNKPSTKTRTAWAIIRGVSLIAALCCTLLPLEARAQFHQSGRRQDPREIRKTAEQILEAPEFRRFQRLQGESDSGSGFLDDLEPRRSGSDSQTQEGSRSDTSRESTGNPNDPNGTSSQPQKNSDDSQESDNEEGSSGWLSLPSGGGALAQFLGLIMHMLAWACLAAICVGIVYLAIQALKNFGWESETNSDSEGETVVEEEPALQSPGAVPADVYLQRAHSLADEGKYREAITQLLLGAMSHIERADRIRYRQGLTYRDYLRAVRNERRLYRTFRGLIRIYEPIGFGRREATHNLFQKSLRGYESGFGKKTPALES